MQVLLIKDNLLDSNYDSIINKRLVDYINTHQVDALCVTKQDDRLIDDIDAFKKKHQKKVKLFVCSGVSIIIYRSIFKVSSDGIIVGDNLILAVDDAICQIEVDNENRLTYHYIPLDLLKDFKMENKLLVSKSSMDAFKKMAQAGQPLVMPLQDFIEIIEENIDDDLKEEIKKAKQELNAKSKS